MTWTVGLTRKMKGRCFTSHVRRVKRQIKAVGGRVFLISGIEELHLQFAHISHFGEQQEQ